MSKVITDARDVVEGQHVGVGTHAVCTHCGRALREGAHVAVYLYRPEDAVEWDAGMLVCDGAWETSPAETLGVHEIWANGRLATLQDSGTQSHLLVLTDVAVLDTSGPGEGTDPA